MQTITSLRGRRAALLRAVAFSACVALSIKGVQAQVFIAADFEDKTAANKFSQASQWSFISDEDSHGTSIITSGDTTGHPSAIDSNSFASPGYGGSKSCFKLAWKYGATRPHGDAPDTSSYDPEVGMVTQIYNESLDVGADFTGATKVSFWAKGEKATKIRLAALTTEVADYAFWGDDFSITTAWKQYNLDFSAKTFTQPEWKSASVPFNIKRITGFQIVISQANNPSVTGALYLDDISVTGWKPKEAPTKLADRTAKARRAMGSFGVTGETRVRVDGRKVEKGRISLPR